MNDRWRAGFGMGGGWIISKMVNNIKVNTKTGLMTGGEFTNGQMVNGKKDSMRVVNETESSLFARQTGEHKKECLGMEKGYDRCMRK